MKRLILILIFSIFLINLVNAEVQTLSTQKQNQCVQIVQSHPNATSINITKISFPSSCNYPINYTIIPMSTLNNINYYYYFCNTSCLGDYIVTTCGNGDGYFDCVDYDFTITPTGFNLTNVQVYIYMFFLIICLFITFFSFKLFNENKETNDKLKNSDLYQIKKRNEFLFYVTLLKRKLWIVGIFGIYLSILLFISLLDLLVYNLGLYELDVILRSTGVVMLWGLIPFILFWLVWLIFTIYKSTVEIMKYQLGNFKN